jgi:hypothetical protein
MLGGGNRCLAAIELVMTDKDIIIGRVINITGMIGVIAGIVLFAFGIAFLVFRHGVGLIF